MNECLKIKISRQSSYQQSRCYPETMDSVCPYRDDSGIDVNPEIYHTDEKKADVNDVALDKFISRVLLSVTVNDDECEDYGISEYFLVHP